eukprot:g2298.t1
MEERSFPKIKGLEDDTFMDALKKYFVNQGVLDEAIFRDGVADQLKAKGLGEPDDASKMDSIVKRLAMLGTVDIFTLAVPRKESDFAGVSMYSDDKAIAKQLMPNPRAIGFARACNFPDQVFRGDVFVGRLVDDEMADIFDRVDFTLKDMQGDAPWIKALPSGKQRVASTGAMQAMLANQGPGQPPQDAAAAAAMQQMAAAGGGGAAGGAGGAAEAGGDCGAYSWTQQDEEIELRFPLHKDAGGAKGAQVKFARNGLKVGVKSAVAADKAVSGVEVLFDGPLFGPVDVDDCTWYVEKDTLVVSLQKAGGAAAKWTRVARDE